MKKVMLTTILTGVVVNAILLGGAFSQEEKIKEEEKKSILSIEFTEESGNSYVITSKPKEVSDKEDVKQQEVKKKSEKAKKTSAQNKKKNSKKATIKSYVAYQKAHSRVSTKCFPPSLRQVLAKIQKRYGAKPIVNSGFRSYSYNRRVGGARKSYHVKCMAADIRVPGVGKYTLARYLKTLSGVGGVGTYGCKTFVHVDVGPKRNWHWRCRKRGRKA